MRYVRSVMRLLPVIGLVLLVLSGGAALAQTSEGAAGHHGGGEANLVLPDVGQVQFLGMSGRALLMLGLLVCGLGSRSA